MDGVAFDTEMFSHLDIFNYVNATNISKDKFEIIYNYYLDNSPSEQFFNYRLFMMFHSFDYYSQYLNKLTDQDIFDVIDILVDTIEDEKCYKIMINTFLKQAHVRRNQEIIDQFIIKVLNKKRIKLVKTIKYLYKEAKRSKKACLTIILLYLFNAEGGKEAGKILAKIAIKKQHFRSAFYLYSFYLKENNFLKAIKYLKIYVDNTNDPEYLIEMAVQYLGGEIIEQNIETGVKLLRAGADLGDSQFQVALAFLNFYGLYVPRNYDQAFWYNSLAMKQNNFSGLYLHRLFYFYGFSFVEQYIVKALEIFEDCLVSLKDYIFENRLKEICFYNLSILLSIIYFLGLGVEVNIERGNKYLEDIKTYLPTYEIALQFRVIELFNMANVEKKFYYQH